MLGDNILEQGILLIVTERVTMHVGFGSDMSNQSAASQFDVIGMRANEADALTKKGHIVIHVALLFGGQESAHDFGHDQLAFLIQTFLGDFGDLIHDLFKVVFALEETAPQVTIF